ncbi:MAG TPA: serine hydrolase domain-containing protein [Candidatus Solibacter sp.]|nr:serine hydrolase domain-containing protein [Candidatus Solibacter sp.]
MKTKTLFAGLLTLALTIASQAQTFDKAKLDQFLDRLAEKNKGMGSVALAKDGNVIYSHSFGYRQVNGNETQPSNAETKYRIASITKMFTAVMIFQLVEEKKLKLTDTLDKFFPQIPNAAKITIGQMLWHRSGIHDIEADGTWGKQHRTKDEVVARIAQGEPDFEPDAQHRYSNAGYILLGYIVEKAGGKPYQEALKERITSKIGLKNTYLGAGNTDPNKNEALSYRYLGGWKEAAELDFSVAAGAGSILSTPTDMTKFLQELFDLKLVSEANLKQMATMRDDEGMGMEAFSFAGKTLYGHTGGSVSSGAWLAYFPDEKVTLAYTTNAKIYPVKDIVSGVFDIYWNRPFQIPTFEAVEVSTEMLDRYAGDYAVPGTPVKVKIIRNGSTLYFQPAGQSAVPIEATAEDKFKIDPFVVFEFDAVKREMTITRAGQKRIFTKEK